jgi:type I restriction enzyme S subunit
MIADLKPYPEYRPAEGGWLGDIPTQWQVRRMKYVVREVDCRSINGKEQLLRVSQYPGVTQRFRDDGLDEPDTRADSLVGYKRVEFNDLVINIMLAWNGSMGVSQYSGIASPAYCVYRFEANLHPWYFHNLLRSPSYKARIKASSRGVVESRLRLYSDDLYRIEALIPPPAEQAAIVRFLDYANGRLERAIRAKRKVIALLNEQKQAIIHSAVTRSFVEHLPLNILRLPMAERAIQGWQSLSVRRLIQQHVLSIQDGNHGELHPKASDYVDDGIPFLMANNVRPEGLDLQGCAKLRERHARELRIGFAHSGDVLLTHKATIGQVGLVPNDLTTPFVMLTPQVTYYRSLGNKIASEYLFLYMQSPLFLEQLKVLSLNQSTRPYVGLIEQKNLVICFPSIDRQSRICAEFKHSIGPVDSARRRAEREIELLREYRARLVADVVTGKLDVREAIARLPEETAPDDPDNDARLIDEANPSDEEIAA